MYCKIDFWKTFHIVDDLSTRFCHFSFCYNTQNTLKLIAMWQSFSLSLTNTNIHNLQSNKLLQLNVVLNVVMNVETFPFYRVRSNGFAFEGRKFKKRKKICISSSTRTIQNELFYRSLFFFFFLHHLNLHSVYNFFSFFFLENETTALFVWCKNKLPCGKFVDSVNNFMYIPTNISIRVK